MKVQISPKVCVIVRRKAPRIVVPLAQKMVPSVIYDAIANHHVPDVPHICLDYASTQIIAHILKI